MAKDSRHRMGPTHLKRTCPLRPKNTDGESSTKTSLSAALVEAARSSGGQLFVYSGPNWSRLPGALQPAVAIAEHCTLTPLTLCLPRAMLNLDVGVDRRFPCGSNSRSAG